MKIKVKSLRKFIAETLIKEEIRLAQDSLDNQIDSIILGFEDDAIIDNVDEPIHTSEGLINLGPLFEAQEDEDESEDEEQQGDEENADIPMKPPAPNLDVQKFAVSVARLANKFQSMIDIPIVIATRAYNYLVSNYDKATADAFEEAMSRHNIELDRPDTSEPEELPIAVGAAASGIGGV